VGCGDEEAEARNEPSVHGNMADYRDGQWDQDYIDLVVPGYIALKEDHLGELQFGTVHGDIDYRVEPYQNTERPEFSWEGEDEMDPVSGRGWAIFADGQLQGRLYFHEGDESGFMAQKER
jgi:hypothetical protein